MTDRTLDAVLTDLVLANRILAHEGVVDDFGHVAVRDPRDPGFFWLSRSRSPEVVTRDDLIRFDLEGRPQEAGHRRPYLETILHARLLAHRPEVNATAHHHARPVLPFTATDVKLRPVFHMGAIIGHDVPVWDSQDEFGDTAMIIDTKEMADSMARAMESADCQLLARHGANCVGRSIQEVVFRAIYMKENAALQLQAMALGAPQFLSAGEIDKTRAMNLGERPMQRSWEYRVARAGFGGI
jgi:HCOMODA/2-hydroxy-3-carboxy-muconic semialdehyde decarboxylase